MRVRVLVLVLVRVLGGGRGGQVCMAVDSWTERVLTVGDPPGRVHGELVALLQWFRAALTQHGQWEAMYTARVPQEVQQALLAKFSLPP